MRTSQTNRYARWSAGAAGILLVIVACVYLHRAWLARQERKSAPPAIPEEIAARSSGFASSKVVGDRTIFTVRASNAVQFKEGDRAALEDVWITFYGSDGARNDNLHTHACDYIAATNVMTCTADIEMDLESADEARLHPSAADGAPSPLARVLHISTSGLSFNGKSGVTHTDRAVNFRFPQGSGRSVGLEGEPPKPRLVISVFDSFEQAQAWRNSPDYVRIAAVRHREAKSRQYIVEGLPE